MPDNKETRIALLIPVLDSVEPALRHDIDRLLDSGLVSHKLELTACLLPLVRNQLILNLNHLLDKQQETYTHILFIDSDTCDVTVSIIEQLIDANEPIVSPLMVSRNPPFMPACDISVENLGRIFKEPIAKRGLYQVGYTGMACTLIKREVIEIIPQPWFTVGQAVRPTFEEEIDRFIKDLDSAILNSSENQLKQKAKEIFLEGVKRGLHARKGGRVLGEDIMFCQEAKRYGFQTFVHTGCYVGHMGKTRFNIGNHLDFLADPTLINRLEQITYVWEKKKGGQ